MDINKNTEENNSSNRAGGTQSIVHSQKEKITSFIYVLFIFVLLTTFCCYCLSYAFGTEQFSTVKSRKAFAISKMERIKTFQQIQKKEYPIVDSLYNKINNFNPSKNATYEENDIKYFLRDIRAIFEKKNYDMRYKIFYQISEFLNMWFEDRKELWSKQQNISMFSHNLEDCQSGLDKKESQKKAIK